jgi:flagellar protein FlaF
MNATAMARRAYSPTAAPMRTAKSAEYEVIARITYRLKKATESNDLSALAESLHENRSLWSALAIDVADPGNQLPAKLRAEIFYLAEFTQRYTSKVLNEKASVIPLLEINTAILRGLKQEGTR